MQPEREASAVIRVDPERALRRLTDDASARRWTQWNLRFVRVDDSPRTNAWALLTALEQQLARASEPVWMWFVRKLPDLRVRVGGPGLTNSMRAQLRDLMEAEQAAGRVDEAAPAVYEPELFRLGGPALIDAVHALFDADTRAYMAWQRIDRSDGARLSGELMSLCLAGDLIARATESSEETWDVWCRLARLYGGALPTPSPRKRPRLVPASLRSFASEGEQAVLDRALRAQAEFVARLDAVAARGALTCGRRGLLGALAAFHWNRWCLREATIASLCASMVRDLHPENDYLRDDEELAR